MTNAITASKTESAQREHYMNTIGRMSTPALKLLAELSQKPGAEKKLLDKAAFIKAFL